MELVGNEIIADPRNQHNITHLEYGVQHIEYSIWQVIFYTIHQSWEGGEARLPNKVA